MKKLRIHYLQHVPFEKLGYIETWANANHHMLSGTRLFENGILPKMDEFDWLIILGGPMGVSEEGRFAWLKGEKLFIGEAIRAGKTVLGICLGSQLIAEVLGARVYQSPKKEIGWFPVSLADPHPVTAHLPHEFAVLHWHGDTYDLPNGAIHLMKTEPCKHQAFIYRERVMGIQFHLETTPETLRQMVENCRHELIAEDFVQDETEIMANQALCELTNGYMIGILNYLDSH